MAGFVVGEVTRVLAGCEAEQSREPWLQNTQVPVTFLLCSHGQQGEEVSRGESQSLTGLWLNGIPHRRKEMTAGHTSLAINSSLHTSTSLLRSDLKQASHQKALSLCPPHSLAWVPLTSTYSMVSLL